MRLSRTSTNNFLKRLGSLRSKPYLCIINHIKPPLTMTKLPVDLILTKAYTADSDLNKFKIFLLENIHRGVCNLSVDDLYDSYIHEYIFADTDEKKLRETWIVGLGWSDIFSDKKIVKEPIQNKNDFKKLIQKHIDLFRLRIALWSWIEVIMRLNPKK